MSLESMPNRRILAADDEVKIWRNVQGVAPKTRPVGN